MSEPSTIRIGEFKIRSTKQTVQRLKAILDKLELEEMQSVVAYLKEIFTNDIVCPFLIYDDNKYHIG